MDKSASTLFQEVKENVSNLATLKLELLKLNTYEQVGKLISLLTYGLVLAFLLFFTLLFIFLALSLYLEELLDHAGAGFFLVSCIYLILLITLVLNKKRIQLKTLNIIIAAMLSNEKNNDEPNSEHISPTISTPNTTESDREAKPSEADPSEAMY